MDLVSIPLTAVPCQGGGVIVVVQKNRIRVALKVELVKWKEKEQQVGEAGSRNLQKQVCYYFELTVASNHIYRKVMYTCIFRQYEKKDICIVLSKSYNAYIYTPFQSNYSDIKIPCTLCVIPGWLNSH